MKKMNNKGFSLVELIIVIAIMAILIGVLAPQYIKYVEKSRASADLDQLDSVYNACTIAAADPEIEDAPYNKSTVSVISSGSWGPEVLTTLGISSMGELKWKSKSAKASGSGATSGLSISVDDMGNFTVKIGLLSVN